MHEPRYLLYCPTVGNTIVALPSCFALLFAIYCTVHKTNRDFNIVKRMTGVCFHSLSLELSIVFNSGAVRQTLHSSNKDQYMKCRQPLVRRERMERRGVVRQTHSAAANDIDAERCPIGVSNFRVNRNGDALAIHLEGIGCVFEVDVRAPDCTGRREKKKQHTGGSTGRT